MELAEEIQNRQQPATAPSKGFCGNAFESLCHAAYSDYLESLTFDL
jgi:hypothetical protein